MRWAAGAARGTGHGWFGGQSLHPSPSPGASCALMSGEACGGCLPCPSPLSPAPCSPHRGKAGFSLIWEPARLRHPRDVKKKKSPGDPTKKQLAMSEDAPLIKAPGPQVGLPSSLGLYVYFCYEQNVASDTDILACVRMLGIWGGGAGLENSGHM